MLGSWLPKVYAYMPLPSLPWMDDANLSSSWVDTGLYKEASTKLQVVGLHERPHRQGKKIKWSAKRHNLI